jgi:sarcosine oxidase subunit beta
VLDKGYIGSGGSGRNTAILRSNYLTPEGVRFYDRSMQLYRTLAADLDFNVMFSRRGHLTLAHNDSSLRTMRWRAEVNQLQGIDSEVIDPAEIKRLVPYLDTSADTRYPILGALYHPPGGIIRHDAVVWGYARAAAAQGVHIHQDTEVTGIDVESGRVRGVRTTKGDIATPVVLNATAGWSTLVAAMAGVRLPIQTFPLQAAVTEPVRPFLHAVIVSGTLHVYVSQTDRGELVFGASVDPFAAYSTRGTLEFAEGLATHVIELMPGLSKMRLLRHLRVQGGPGLRGGHGAVHRRRPRPGDHRGVRDRPVRRGRAGRREGGGRGWSLTWEAARHDPHPVSLVRPEGLGRVPLFR